MVYKRSKVLKNLKEIVIINDLGPEYIATHWDTNLNGEQIRKKNSFIQSLTK